MMLAPTLTVRLRPSQREDLATICAIDGTQLRAVATALRDRPFTIRRERIESIIKNVLGAEGAGALTRMLFGIAGSFRRLRVSADDALDQITKSLDDAKPDERFKAWPDCRAAIRDMLMTETVALAAKAIDVSYDFERVYIAGRLLTSIRPVFDDTREDIRGTTIVQTLRLEYIGQDGDRSNISIAMDLDDIKELIKECERATKKALAAKSRIELNCGIDSIIAGEDDSE